MAPPSYLFTRSRSLSHRALAGAASRAWRLALLAVLPAGLGRAEPPAAVAAFPVRAVGPIELTVSDLDRSLAFYTEVLAFEKLWEREVLGEPYERMQGLFGVRLRLARLRLGDEEIELTEYLTPAGRPAPPDQRSNDRWFQHIALIVSDMDGAYARLRQHKVRHASTAPQTLPAWNKNAGGIRAFYFRDPDGHALELLWFPPDKGVARWHRQDRLFLGIDHTAIVVGDTERSLRLYRDLLGLRIAGTSDNHGTEQAHLNSVEGAHLRITSLRAAAGPGIELLEYLAPRDGRPFPTDERASDLIHWQTALVTTGVDEAARRLRTAGYAPVSRAVVALPEPALGARKAFLARDPDGHVLELVEP